jgi:hypothetical protein
VDKIDLSAPNHLIFKNSIYLKVSFLNQNELYNAKKALLPLIKKNKKHTISDIYSLYLLFDLVV